MIVMVLFSTRLAAQFSDRPQLTWDDFVEEYLVDIEGDNDLLLPDDEVDRLEILSEQTLQLNRVSRQELLALPFLTAEQVDSILSYRRQKHGIHALGELQLIRGIDYFTRRYLSLFVRCDSLPIPDSLSMNRWAQQGRLVHRLYQGSHQIETLLDVPCYRRAGYKTPSQPSATNYYTGNSLRHLLRYRYQYRQDVAYGITVEKDAGEPVGKVGFYPYDYISGYLVIQPRDKAWTFALGDYEINIGRGLLFGRQYYGGAEQITRPTRNNIRSIRPHTSTNEYNFFRGGSVSRTLNHWRVTLFSSYRKLDARMEGDTARTLLTTGLHRTIREIENRRTLGSFTGGGILGYQRTHLTLNLTSYFVHYDHPISPVPRYYNTHYFRGNKLHGTSLSYTMQRKAWSISGEIGLDKAFHCATEQLISYTPSYRFNLNLQLRTFSPRYIGPYASPQQQGNRSANEQGVLLGVRYLPVERLELSGYADFFRFPKPTYSARLSGSKGMETQIQAKWEYSSRWQALIRYRFKTKQYTISGHELLEYRHRQKIRLAVILTGNKFSLNMQGDLTAATRQTGKSSWGYMPSIRLNYSPTKKLTMRGFAGLFMTDDYESAVYAYEPRLYRTAGFTALFDHGMRWVSLCDWRPIKSLTLSCRLAHTCFFNRSVISSGTDAIYSKRRSDISLQCRWQIH